MEETVEYELPESRAARLAFGGARGLRLAALCHVLGAGAVDTFKLVEKFAKHRDVVGPRFGLAADRAQDGMQCIHH